MLNIFPIQFLAPLAYFLLRIATAYLFVRMGLTHLRNRGSATLDMQTPTGTPLLFLTIGILEIAVGALLFFGAYTQIGALMGSALALFQSLRTRHVAYPQYPPRIFFGLLAVVCVSLFITGAGAFAFDLPL